MLQSMQRLARVVFPVRHLLGVMIALCVAAFAYILLSGDPALDAYLLPTLAALGWSLCLLGITIAFTTLPEPVQAGDRFFQRMRKRFRRFISWIWSVCFIVCSAMLLFLSFRALSLALASP
ncbi:MAG: hypothetical protein AAF184_14155 [Pseudomonadota bacterium]